VIAVTSEVDALLAAGAPVAIGVSGGKDSCALAFAVAAHLDATGHAGPRLLVHSDLGRTEWRDSLPTCRRLAHCLGVELAVVRRQAGDMMDRWLGRWSNNVGRYEALSCVKLIPPWSTASMRFCTSELKTDVITAYLTKRFAGRPILSASGIRREESPKRKRAPVAKRQAKLCRRGCMGLDWNAIVEWRLADVLGRLKEENFTPHEAYTRYRSSRVSCVFCILASKGDLMAAAGCRDNHDVYREMVGLEVASTFSFHDKLWLGDVAPHLLTPGLRDGLVRAKAAARARTGAEAAIPGHLLYVDGWPTCVPTWTEASLLACTRATVAAAVGLKPTFTGPAEVIGRYEQLMSAKALKGA
jgi:3'-phosphoadenosine 5'-phosphosulfate sulfotransferase (PAPS reductase)/FAD synthetase